MARGSLLLALSLWAACSPVARDAEGFEVDPPGAWYAGDLHVHATGASNDTGGDSLPADIARVAKERGLAFVVLTDHSNSTGSDPSTRAEDPELFNQGPEFVYVDEAARLSIPGSFLMVSGNELSPVAEGDFPTEPRGHVGCIPKVLEGFDADSPFIDRPKGAVRGGDALRQAKARGCFTVVNHPFAQAPWIRFDWSEGGHDAIEVWNGGLGLDEADLEAHAAWRCDLLAGRKVVPVGASDNHRVNLPPPGYLLDPALGYPSTSVYATELTWPAVMEALSAGRVAIHEGESFLALDGYDEARRRREDGATRVLRLRGRLDPAVPTALITLTRATSCRDPRPTSRAPELEEEVVFRHGVRGGASFDHAVPIDGAPGVYTAILRGESEHYAALSRAVVIRGP